MVAHRKVSDHRPNRSTACRWRFTLAPENARHSAALIRPDVGKVGAHFVARLGPRNQTPRTVASERLRCHAGCFPDFSQEQLYSKPPLKPVSASGPSGFGDPAVSLRPSLLARAARTRRPGSLRYNCVLCPLRRLRCHADCPALPGGRANPMALQSSRQLAGILHANSAEAGQCDAHSGRLSPNCPRPTPIARPPAIPQGGCAGPEKLVFKVAHTIRQFHRRSPLAFRVKNRAVSVPAARAASSPPGSAKYPRNRRRRPPPRPYRPLKHPLAGRDRVAAGAKSG